MKMARTQFLKPFLVLFATPVAWSNEVVWVVDDDAGAGVDFAAIQAAVDAAADGDTVLVKAGTYDPFAIVGKSLVVTGESGELVEVVAASTGLHAIEVRDLLSSQSVAIRGIQGVAEGVTDSAVLALDNNQGPVWIEDCEFALGASSPFVLHLGPMVEVASSTLTMLRCCVRGGPDLVGNPAVADTAMVATQSALHLYDCLLVGGVGATGEPGLATDRGDSGLSLEDGFLFASGCTFEGGEGGLGYVQGFPLPLCTPGGDGGPGLELPGATGSEAFLLGCTLLGGLGGAGLERTPTIGPCADGAPGPDFDAGGNALTFLTGVARAFQAESPARGGESPKLTFEGPPGEFLFLLWSTAHTPVPLIPFQSTVLVGNPLFFASVGSMPPAGVKELDPVLTEPGCDATTLYLQPLHVNAALEAYWAQGSALTILSSSF